jgi:L-threonylcarbamoyladenylate synthase
MNQPRVVGLRHQPEVRAALADGQIVAVPFEGGYQLASGLSTARPDAFATVHAQGSSVASDDPVHVVVGRQAQASELVPMWSKEASLLTDRMWPGPLTVIVPAAGSPDETVHLTMPSTRVVRMLCRDGGPLRVVALRRPDGRPVTTVAELSRQLADTEVGLILNGGTCDGPGPTVVDCTVSPPQVRRVGALPEAYVEATLMMAGRRKWFSKRAEPD